MAASLSVTGSEGTRNIGANTSYVNVTIKAISKGSYNYNPGGCSWSATFSNGNNSYTKNGTFEIKNGATVTIFNGEVGPFTHNSDGTSNAVHVSANAKISSAKPTAELDISLAKIDRFATCSQSYSNVTERTVYISWSSDSTIDYVWYSTNNGGSWTAVGSVNASSGGYTISGLSPGSGYNIKTRVRRKDSQLTTDSSASYVVTYALPSYSGGGNFTIGNGITIGQASDRGLSCTTTFYADDGSTKIINNGGTQQSVIGSTDEWKTFLYKSIPNKPRGSYRIRFQCSAASVDTYSSYYTYSITNNEKPNFATSNVINVADTLHVSDITGNSNYFISGHNKLTGTIKPMTTSYQAGLTNGKYTIASSGLATVTKNYSTSNVTFELSNVTANTFRVTAIDGRNLSQYADIPITIIPYSKPTMKIPTLTRQNGTGEYVDVTLEGNYTNWSKCKVANGVTSVRYRVKPTTQAWGSQSWYTLTTSNADGVWKVAKTRLNGTYGNTTKYDIEFEIKDKLETVVISGYTISTANCLIWRDLKNKRVGIGKKPDYNLDVEGSLGISAGNGQQSALYMNGVKILWWE